MASGDANEVKNPIGEENNNKNETEQLEQFSFETGLITEHQRKVFKGLKEDSLKIFRTNVILAGAFLPIVTIFLKSENLGVGVLFQNNNISSAMVGMVLSIGFAFMTYQSASDAISKAVPLSELANVADEYPDGWTQVIVETENGELKGYISIYEETVERKQKEIKETRWYNSASMFFLYAATPLLGIGTLDSMFGMPNWILGLVLLPLLFALFTVIYLHHWRPDEEVENRHS